MTKNILTVIVPFIAFGIVLMVNRSTVADVSTLFIYGISIVILIGAFFIGQQKPVRTLVTLGILGVLFMLVGLFSTGMLAVFSFISGGLCCSIRRLYHSTSTRFTCRYYWHTSVIHSSCNWLCIYRFLCMESKNRAN
jgi:hypothetical protein